MVDSRATSCYSQCIKAVDACEGILELLPLTKNKQRAVGDVLDLFARLQLLHAGACHAAADRHEEVQKKKQDYEAMQLELENRRKEGVCYANLIQANRRFVSAFSDPVLALRPVADTRIQDALKLQNAPNLSEDAIMAVRLRDEQAERKELQEQSRQLASQAQHLRSEVETKRKALNTFVEHLNAVDQSAGPMLYRLAILPCFDHVPLPLGLRSLLSAFSSCNVLGCGLQLSAEPAVERRPARHGRPSSTRRRSGEADKAAVRREPARAHVCIPVAGSTCKVTFTAIEGVGVTLAKAFDPALPELLDALWPAEASGALVHSISCAQLAAFGRPYSWCQQWAVYNGSESAQGVCTADSRALDFVQLLQSRRASLMALRSQLEALALLQLPEVPGAVARRGHAVDFALKSWKNIAKPSLPMPDADDDKSVREDGEVEDGGDMVTDSPTAGLNNIYEGTMQASTADDVVKVVFQAVVPLQYPFAPSQVHVCEVAANRRSQSSSQHCLNTQQLLALEAIINGAASEELKDELLAWQISMLAEQAINNAVAVCDAASQETVAGFLEARQKLSGRMRLSATTMRARDDLTW